MTTTPTFTDPDVGPQIKRDSHGRYLLPHPDTGQVRAWTRVTTFADVVTSHHALHSWDESNVAWGMAQRPDLISLASSLPDPRDPQLREIINQAKEASDAAAARNKGQAIHAWTERVDREEAGFADIPVLEDREDVRAYVDTLTAAGIDIYEDDTGPWIERVVLLPQLDDGKTVAGVAGQLDRVVICDSPDWPAPRILDLKTGQNVMRFGMTKVPLQGAMYAHAKYWWDPTTDTLGPMPSLDLERMVIAHVAAGSGHCELFNVNIAQGWRMVEVGAEGAGVATDGRRRVWWSRSRRCVAAPPSPPSPRHRRQRNYDAPTRVTTLGSCWTPASPGSPPAAEIQAPPPATPTAQSNASPPSGKSNNPTAPFPISPRPDLAPPATKRSTPSPPCAPRSKPTTGWHSKPPTRGHPQPPRPTESERPP